MPRSDETQYRLLAWSGDSAAAERLAVQILLASGFTDPDPSHPYGGPDGGRDGMFTKDSKLWVMAVYFPRSNPSFNEIKAKFKSDLDGALKYSPHGVAFVTNQELTLGQRSTLKALTEAVEVDIFHMERVAALLDQPVMAGLRQQFLGIDPSQPSLALSLEIVGVGRKFTGGEVVREELLDSEDAELRLNAERSRNMPQSERDQLTQMAKLLNQQPPADPPTVEEVEGCIDARRVRVERDWTRIEDYVAGMAWPSLNFIVTNEAPSFLHDVRLVITFDGAYGVAKDHPVSYEYEKLLDPDYKRPYDPLYSSAVSYYDPPNPADYPVAWRNLDSGLEVRITLPELPPGREFRWEGEDYEDVVLVARRTSRSVAVAWVAVARGHGTQFVGTGLDLDIEEMPLREALADVERQCND